MASILAIDFGSKRIGVAIADDQLKLALPLGILDKRGAEADILRIISERGISTVVFGLPLNEDNSEGPGCQLVRKFAKRISKRASVKIAFIDEYGSSAEAHEILSDHAPGRLVDHAAAVLILEQYIKTKL